MKDFLKMFVAASLALAVSVGGCLGFGVLAAAVAGSKSKGDTYQDAMLIVDLSSPIQDKPTQSDPEEAFRRAMGETDRKGPIQLFSVLRAIRHAKTDPNIKGILLVGEVPHQGYSSGLAALKELREALADFRKSEKRVVAYAMHLDEATYLIDSVADEMVLHPFGQMEINGIASQGLFFAKALEKLGVGVQVTRVGKYKSAVEPFLLEKMSEPNREQLQTLLDDLWKNMVAVLSDARKTTPEELQKFVDAGGLVVGKAAVEAKLVDKTAYFDELLVELKGVTHSENKDKTFKQVEIKSYIETHKAVLAGTQGKKLAVIYAEGNIVDGNNKDEVGGDTLARLLRKARLDDSISAVVLRVNSPGGSATASEVIGREVRLIKENKPVIVSMGTVAASGGYWISAYANRIFAEPSTITGSIGVFGLLLNVSTLSNNMGVNVDTVKTGAYADITSGFRFKTEKELEIIQQQVDHIYADFIDRVSEGRGLERAQVEEIAQGRVWSGERAKTLGLVDELGGLEDAISAAAKEASLGDDFTVVTFQQERSPFQQILEALGEKNGDGESHSTGVNRLVDFASSRLRALESLNDPQDTYARLPIDVMIE